MMRFLKVIAIYIIICLGVAWDLNNLKAIGSILLMIGFIALDENIKK